VCVPAASRKLAAELPQRLQRVRAFAGQHVGQPGGDGRLAQLVDLPGQLPVAVGPRLLLPLRADGGEPGRVERVQLGRHGVQIHGFHYGGSPSLASVRLAGMALTPADVAGTGGIA